MPDDRLSVDVSSLDGLGKIKAEQQTLRDLAARAAEHRDNVTEVYNRVVRDYEARIRSLDEQAQRLRVQVREDFGRLNAAYADARQALNQARFDLQESEFRKEVGEFSGEEFVQRQRAIEATINDRQRELDAIAQLRTRFVELLPPDVSPPLVPVPTPRSAPVAVAVATSPAQVASNVETCLPLPTYVDFRVPPVPVVDRSMEADQTGAIRIPAFETTASAPVGELVEDRPGAEPVVHQLGAMTRIGRAPDNQIVIPFQGVSRRHAEVVTDQTGFLLRDLGSPNGTFVNGQRVTEHPLQDGDRIAMADVTFVFHMK
jgi:hypothetical protein